MSLENSPREERLPDVPRVKPHPLGQLYRIYYTRPGPRLRPRMPPVPAAFFSFFSPAVNGLSSHGLHLAEIDLSRACTRVHGCFLTRASWSDIFLSFFFGPPFSLTASHGACTSRYVWSILLGLGVVWLSRVAVYSLRIFFFFVSPLAVRHLGLESICVNKLPSQLRMEASIRAARSPSRI